MHFPAEKALIRHALRMRFPRPVLFNGRMQAGGGHGLISRIKMGGIGKGNNARHGDASVRAVLFHKDSCYAAGGKKKCMPKLRQGY